MDAYVEKDGMSADQDAELQAAVQRYKANPRDKQTFQTFQRLSRDTGDPQACYNLGVIFFEGLGAKKDIAECERCWIRASERGNTKAAYSLACLYHKGEGNVQESGYSSQIDAVKAYMNIAAQQNHPGAKEALRQIQQVEAENIAPENLVGQAVDVAGHGIGQVVDFSKGQVMGFGASRHTVSFQNGTVIKKLVLSRHNNGGAPFTIVPTSSSGSLNVGADLRVNMRFKAKIARIPSNGHNPKLAKIPTNQNSL